MWNTISQAAKNIGGDSNKKPPPAPPHLVETRHIVIIPPEDLEYQEMVGKGAFGEVWSAKWKGRGGGEIVAVKKIATTGANEAMKRKVFEEVETLHRLSYRHIVQIYGCFMLRQELLIVLEFVPGNLYGLLHSDAALPWPARIKIALQAARALNYLHSARPPILHRDIKSANFLTQKHAMELKLTDFGMAKILEASAPASLSTLGTCRWGAPETMTRKPLWTPRADIYSLGMTFFEIASRQLPFQDVQDQVVISLVQQKERPDIPPDCPSAFAEIIEECWAHDPESRPALQKVISVLEKILEGFAQTPRELPTPKPKPRVESLFFEIKSAELLQVVPASCCTRLTECPTFPGAVGDRPRVPKEVCVVSLQRNVKKHILLSRTYDTTLFDRVEMYFRRFYTPHDSSYNVVLDSVDVILNSEVEKRFREAENQFHSEYNGLQELRDQDQSELQRYYLNKLFTSENLWAERNSNPISVWHGTDANNLNSIYWYGMLNLNSTDPGYYGKGIYCTQYPEYGEYYAEQFKAKNNGRFSLILCWVLLGRPWAASKVSMGAKCEPNYTSHFSIVTKKGAHRECCATKSDFDELEGLTNYFPVVNKQEEVQGDEIVLFNPAHILPRYVVHYTIEKSRAPPGNPNSPIVPQTNPTPNFTAPLPPPVETPAAMLVEKDKRPPISPTNFGNLPNSDFQSSTLPSSPSTSVPSPPSSAFTGKNPIPKPAQVNPIKLPPPPSINFPRDETTLPSPPETASFLSKEVPSPPENRANFQKNIQNPSNLRPAPPTRKKAYTVSDVPLPQPTSPTEPNSPPFLQPKFAVTPSPTEPHSPPTTGGPPNRPPRPKSGQINVPFAGLPLSDALQLSEPTSPACGPNSPPFLQPKFALPPSSIEAGTPPNRPARPKSVQMNVPFAGLTLSDIQNPKQTLRKTPQGPIPTPSSTDSAGNTQSFRTPPNAIPANSIPPNTIPPIIVPRNAVPTKTNDPALANPSANIPGKQEPVKLGATKKLGGSGFLPLASSSPRAQNRPLSNLSSSDSSLLAPPSASPRSPSPLHPSATPPPAPQTPLPSSVLESKLEKCILQMFDPRSTADQIAAGSAQAQQLFGEFSAQLNSEALAKVSMQLTNAPKPDLDIVLMPKDAILRLPAITFEGYINQAIEGSNIDELRAIRYRMPVFNEQLSQSKWVARLDNKIAELSDGLDKITERVAATTAIKTNLNELLGMFQIEAPGNLLEEACEVIVMQLKEFVNANKKQTKFRTLNNKAIGLRMLVAEAVRVPKQRTGAYSTAKHNVEDAVRSLIQSLTSGD